MYKEKTKEAGFTLIELMVVIASIAILATVVLVSLQGARDGAEDVNRMSAISQLRSLAYAGEISDFENLEEVSGGFGEVLCEYGSTGQSAYTDCRWLDILSMGMDEDEGEFCLSIQLKKQDDEGHRYFCIDSDLTGKEYSTSEHACAGDHPFCSN